MTRRRGVLNRSVTLVRMLLTASVILVLFELSALACRRRRDRRNSR